MQFIFFFPLCFMHIRNHALERTAEIILLSIADEIGSLVDITTHPHARQSAAFWSLRLHYISTNRSRRVGPYDSQMSAVNNLAPDI
jgi:hypothetical protein